MSPRLTVLFAAALGIATAACASEQASLLPTASAPANTADAPGSAAAPVSTVAAFAGAYQAACELDSQTLEIAVESYFAQYGGTEVAETDLFTAHLIREESTMHDLTADGTIVRAPASPCTE
jgi:hypothetical protein